MASKVVLVFSKTKEAAIAALQNTDYIYLGSQTLNNLRKTGHAFITEDNEIIDEDILLWKGLCSSTEESTALYQKLLHYYCKSATQHNLKVFLFQVHDG